MRMAIEFGQFEECDSVPGEATGRTSWEGVLRDFLGSGMRCAVLRLENRRAATNARSAAAATAARLGLRVRVVQRGKAVYMARMDGVDADEAR